LRSNKRIGLREPEDVAHHLFDSIIMSRPPWKVDVWRRTIQFFFSPSDSGSENFQRFLVFNQLLEAFLDDWQWHNFGRGLSKI
jgi:transposase